MSATTIGPYRAGELADPIVVTFKDAAGNALDFSVGSWTAKWIYRSYGGAQQTKNAIVSTAASGPTKGQVTYTWVLADMATPGDYEAEMWVGNGSTRRYASVQFGYQIAPAIAVPVI